MRQEVEEGPVVDQHSKYLQRRLKCTWFLPSRLVAFSEESDTFDSVNIVVPNSSGATLVFAIHLQSWIDKFCVFIRLVIAVLLGRHWLIVDFSGQVAFLV